VQSLDTVQKMRPGMGDHAWCLIAGDLALWAESSPRTSAAIPPPHLLSLLQPQLRALGSSSAAFTIDPPPSPPISGCLQLKPAFLQLALSTLGSIPGVNLRSLRHNPALSTNCGRKFQYTWEKTGCILRKN
jgi:hypothetical protein